MKTKPILLTLTVFALFSCGSLRNTTMADCAVAEVLEATTQVASSTSATFDEGVVINGVRWATRNVDAPGTFAPYPESSGMLFQWNRKKAWNTTDKEVEGWDNSIPEGTKWYAENDPCPEGWRVPTYNELQSLFDTGRGMGRQWYFIPSTGVRAIRFFDRNKRPIIDYSIFLRIVGYRDSRFGTFHTETILGSGYWSSTRSNAQDAKRLTVHNDDAYVNDSDTRFGFSIRCVAK